MPGTCSLNYRNCLEVTLKMVQKLMTWGLFCLEQPFNSTCLHSRSHVYHVYLHYIDMYLWPENPW